MTKKLLISFCLCAILFSNCTSNNSRNNEDLYHLLPGIWLTENSDFQIQYAEFKEDSTIYIYHKAQVTTGDIRVIAFNKILGKWTSKDKIITIKPLKNLLYKMTVYKNGNITSEANYTDYPLVSKESDELQIISSTDSTIVIKNLKYADPEIKANANKLGFNVKAEYTWTKIPSLPTDFLQLNE